MMSNLSSFHHNAQICTFGHFNCSCYFSNLFFFLWGFVFAGFDLFSTKLAHFESSPDLSQPSFMKKEQMKSTPVYEIATGVSELCVHYI